MNIVTQVARLFDIDEASAEALIEYFEPENLGDGEDLLSWITQEQNYIAEIVAMKVNDEVWTRTYVL